MGTCHNIALAILVCVFAKVSSQGNIGGGGGCSGIPQCSSNPCDDAICPNHPQARCKLLVDNCGNCKAVFFTDKGNLETSDCFRGDGSCQPCKPDPCAQSSCPLQPGASCSSDTCKGCVAEFTFGGEVLADADCMIGSGPTLPCPDGRPRVRCPNNPCDDAACDSEPEAECRANSCGGCSAHFYVGNRRISDLVCLGIETCPPGSPGCESRSFAKCQGRTCLAVPDAKCIFDGCRGCNVIFYKGGKRLTEEDCQGCPTRDCDPCANAKCPDFPNARCESRRCGQCKAVFYGRDRTQIRRCCKAETCDDGSLKFHCKKDPCDGATCRAFPKATCRANNCGGCRGEFFLPNGNKLSDLDCVPFQYCPPNVLTAKCSGDNCLGETCPRYPGAQCKIEGCNGCRAIFYFEGKRLTREDCHGCPNGDRVPECLNPCEGAFCQGNRGARCEPQVCGECKARFYGLDRKELTSCSTSSDTCPRGSRQFNCVVSPCKLHSCPGVRDAECRESYCGGCKAEFYYKDSSNRIPDYMCVEKEPCPGDLSVAGCDGPQPCLGQTCPNFPEAQCYVDGCNGCHVTFYSGRRRLTREDCHGCPAGTSRMSCGNICKNSLCPLHPDARCEPRTCGRCSTVFYGLDRREIADCCASGRIDTPPPPPTPPTPPPSVVPPPPPQTCPSGYPPRNCEPCQNAQCPEVSNARCQPLRCGTCKASFFGRDGTEIESCCEPAETCPDGSDRFHCNKNPCDDATCPGMPGAVCTPNYCGGCNAEFYSRDTGEKYSEADCVALEPCPRNLRTSVCSGRGKCHGRTCPNYPNAECKSDDCNGCNIIFFNGRRRLTEEDCYGCPRRDFVADCDDPCNGAVCSSYPDARCEARRCGTCRPVFYGQDRLLISNCGGNNGFCSNGKPRYNCLAEPCTVKTCPGVPTATCRADYCGGCNALFFYSDGKPVPEYMCALKEPCPGDLPVARCLPGCLGKKCPFFPNAECYLSGCNGCGVVFYNGRKRLTNEDCNGCPPGLFIDRDCEDPCKNAICPLYPGARCEARRCGVCKVVFYEPGFKEIKDCCGQPEPPTGGCPDDEPRVECDVDPCDGAKCPAEPHARCISNNCGECRTGFFLGDVKLTYEQCGLCANGKESINCGFVPQCFEPKCPAYPSAVCRYTNCGECREWYEDEQGNVVDCDGSSSCPNPINCGIVPQCYRPKCAAYPSAVCKSTNCGECREWYENEQGTVVDCDARSCPGNKIRVPCSAPCIDSCEIQHDACIEICDSNINCICPKDFVEETSGSHNCIPRKDCPKPDQCPPDAPISICEKNPCDGASCPGNTGAICMPNFCGGCFAEFYFRQRKLSDMECVKNPDDCAAFTTCDRNVCNCPARRDAQCVVQYCLPNTCRPLYFDANGKKLSYEECEREQCPPDAPISSCKKNPCDGASCPGNTGAICRPNYCGGCFAEFYFRQRKLSDMECVKNPDDCAAFTTCDRNVCNCPAQRDAQCVVQYCSPNTCKPLYFDANGKKLSDGDCGLCEDGTILRNCGIVPPCLFSNCPAYPDAECRVNNCGFCREYFVDSSGQTVDCEKKLTCKVPSDIPHGVLSPNDRTEINVGELVLYRCNVGFRRRGGARRICIERRGRTRLSGNVPKCFDKRCPEVTGGGSSCTSQCNTNGECGFKGMCCWNGCASTCVDTPSPCRDGLPERQCFVNPCDFSTCSRYPSATCKPNYCGGCFREWYVDSRKLEPDDCDKPTDSRCPPLSMAIPVCVNLCSSDRDCSLLEVCCYNGCGHRCIGFRI